MSLFGHSNEDSGLQIQIEMRRKEIRGRQARAGVLSHKSGIHSDAGQGSRFEVLDIDLESSFRCNEQRSRMWRGLQTSR